MPDMSYNTTNGQPPMSLVGGGTNVAMPQQQTPVMPTPQAPQMSMMPQGMQTITVPTAILQHPAVQMGVQKAQQDMAQAASQMPKADISMGTPMAKNIINNMQAFTNSGLMDSYAKQHPILNPIATAMAAFGQGITKQPFLTDMLQNQQTHNQQLIDAASKGVLSPEQKFINDMRQQQLQDREQSMKNTQAQRDQSNWSQFINKVNPATASSRSTLGMTANGNMRANRALATIQNNPVMTYQDLGNVVADLAGIYQGGAPTDMGMKHQQYDSIQSRIANMQQFLTGKPTDAVPSDIKQKLMGTINSLKDVNNASLKNTLDSMESAQKTLISKHPDEWQQFRKGIENDYMNGDNPQQGSLNPTGSVASQASQANAMPFSVGQQYNGHKILGVQKVS